MKPWSSLLTALFSFALILSGCATSAIHEAASAGNMGKLEAYVEGGGDLEEKGDKNWGSGFYHYGGKTPLHMAVEGNQPKAIRYLISQGADIEAKTGTGETPLLLSVKAGNMAVFDLLLSNGAERFAVDENGNTALLVALDALAEHPLKALETAEALIQRGADVNAANRWRRTPLHLAAKHHLEAVARLLIQQGAKINALNKDGESPLYVSLERPYAAYGLPDHDSYRSKTFEYLVTLKQDLQVQNNKGRTLLHRTCHPDYIRILLDKNAPKDKQNQDGDTPFFFALEFCPADAVAVYLDRGFSPKSTGVKGRTVVQAGLSNAYFREEVVSFVIAEGADVTQQDSAGQSAIHQAAAHSPQILDLVIRHGGDINARAKTNATPLHVAASIDISRIIGKDFQKERDLNNETYAHLLSKPGIKINPEDIKGCTPLHRAVNSGSRKKIRLLIERGADVNAKEERGHTPMDMAVFRKDERMVDLFRQHGATSSVDPTKSYRVLCSYP